MAISETTAIIIGCIIGATFLIVFGILLWFFCHKKDNTKYGKISQNENDTKDAKDDMTNGTQAILETEPLSPADGDKDNNNNNTNTTT
eukprot:CAMPEP_0201567974 /NCGR_PEP_ID=MMETSP0190_2-20130828/8782_1 /ASSEMBLY_ACC=CAM_ASM_000263 /TAXON_ID=37353 /ORGANISM="Rosalina sp." /LENGTH=87 /DNA_ID=CAMNT_0047988589 /DNA_START=14 /DNA_END=273 /DNA_ORIENTATION=-